MSHKVVALVLDSVGVFELAITSEIFGTERPDLGVDLYSYCIATAEPGPVMTSAGYSINVEGGLEQVAEADTVIVCPTYPIRPYSVEMLDALRAAHQRGARIVSVCTGVFALAQAGLVEGRRVTTHWMRAEELAASYPGVEVDPDVLYIDDGDIATSAGTASGIDLCLHLVSKDHGAELANAIARRLVVSPQRTGGQSQFMDQPIPLQQDADLFEDTLTWAREHIDQPITVEQLAACAAMSPRTFARRFRAVTGTTPHKWLMSERVRLAQRMLETTDRTIDWVAIDAGFGTGANMRQHFQRLVSISPSQYRKSFRRI